MNPESRNRQLISSFLKGNAKAYKPKPTSSTCSQGGRKSKCITKYLYRNKLTGETREFDGCWCHLHWQFIESYKVLKPH